MSFIDPGGLFGSFQRVQHEDDLDMSEQSKSQVAQIRTALFGTACGDTSTESVDDLCFSHVQSISEATISPPMTDIEHHPVASCYADSVSDFFDTPIEDTSLYDVSILGVPESGARSRTETQVKLILHVVPRPMVPPANWLVLPKHQLASRRGGVSVEETPAEETLFVRARVIRSDSDERVYACYSCILRERKKDFRKRVKSSDDGIGDESFMYNTMEKETEQDRERIVIFASQNERVQLLRGDVMLPVRLTCYCRHVDEPVGFRVKLELLNSNHRLVGFAYSPPILITDDHKRVGRQGKPEVSTMPITPNAFIASHLPSVHTMPTLSAMPATPTVSHQAEPRILKVIPAEGPMYGGIEVTVLGENLSEHTVLMFGQFPAGIVNVISSSTVVVKLPPSHTAGVVSVIASGAVSVDEYVLFNYKNDLDRAMMELALQLIGMKMTGRVDDACDIAMRIINEFSPGTSVGSHSGNQSSGNLERVLITCLAATESTGGLRLDEEDVLKVQTVGGQNLLHLAALTQYDHLFEYLSGMGNGRLLKSVDNNGFTPIDHYLFAGRREFLETLGLDDSDDEESTGVDILSRYRLIQTRARERSQKQPSSLLSLMSDAAARLRRRPARMKNHMNRLKNVIWRKLTSEESIKKYYLDTFGTTSIAQSASNKLYQSFVELQPVRQKSRDFFFVYFWIPILIAMILFWYFNLGSNVMQTVSSWTDTPQLLVQ